jgi:chemotaxis protein MotB
MKSKYYLMAAFACLSLHSCVVLSPKKYKSLLGQRDSLNNRTVDLENTNYNLGDSIKVLKRQIADDRTKYDALNDKHNALDTQYNTLNTSYKALNDKYGILNGRLSKSSSKVDQLAADLAKREERLKEVEDALHKQDAATNALKNKLQQALLGFQQNGLTVDVRNGKVYVSLADKLLFPSGSIIINDQGKQALKQLAVVLNKEADINIAVEGHTDDKKVINLGQIKDNWDLSVLRSTSVCRYLTETEKVDPHRLTATGKSEYQPIDPDNTTDARTKNRRIEIILTPKLDELYNLIKQ